LMDMKRNGLSMFIYIPDLRKRVSKYSNRCIPQGFLG
jgi:hypothetical protein